MAPIISHTLEKVDKALARLQDLQTSIVCTRRDLEAYESSERLKLSRLNRSPRFECHQFLGSCKKLTQCAEICNVKDDRAPAISGDWRQWSAPAEIVHQAMSEILVASKFAKDMAAMLTDSIERQREQESKKKLLQTDINPENKVEKPCPISKNQDVSVAKFKVVVPLQGPAGQKKSCDDVEGRKAECSKISITQPTSLFADTGSNTWQPSLSAEEASKLPMEAMKIKTAQKLWKVSFPTKAVMFPNQTFAPGPSSSLPSLRSSTPSRHEIVSNSTGDRKCLKPIQNNSRINRHQRSLSADKLQGPSKTVSIKAKVMSPTSRTGGTFGKSQSTSSVSGFSMQPKKFGGLPISTSLSENKNATKLSSNSSRLDAKDCNKKRQGSSTLSQVRSGSSLRPSKTKVVEKSEGHTFREQQSRGYEKKIGRPRSPVVVKDKENLEIQGCTPAALCLKRNWFNDRVSALLKNGSGEH